MFTSVSIEHLKMPGHGGSLLMLVKSRKPEKVRYKVIGGEMKGMESSMKLVALGATQRKG